MIAAEIPEDEESRLQKLYLLGIPGIEDLEFIELLHKSVELNVQ